MAAELVGGAFLGAAVGELVSAILDLGERALNFSPVLKDIKSKLDAIAPLVKQIDELNDAMDYPKQETEKLRDLMVEGKQLLLECGDAKLGKLSYLKRPFYTQKLRDLDGALRSFMDILLLQMARDQKKNLKMMNQLMEIVCRLDRGGGGLGKPADLFVPPCLVPELRQETIGLDKAVEELKVKLFRNGVQMVLVTAPGGGGKTTLALKFCHDNHVKSIFQDKIFFVAVSKKPNLKLITKNIIQSLRGIQLPDFQSEEHAFIYLQLWLKQTAQKPILIVLDDVWEGPESECLLEKLLQMPRCKVFVTSRFLFPSFCDPYYLQPLNDEEVMKLFHSSASLGTRKSKLPDEDIIKKIVEGCKRLPLALKVVGRSLSGKPASDWKVAGRKLSRAGSIFESEKEVLECLQSSLEVLNDKMVIKECFMDLGSFPEDQRIPASTFIDLCGVLYGQDEDEAMATIDELSSRSLVNPITTRNDASDDDYYSEYFFTQHDILRELAIHLINSQPIELRKRLILDTNGNDLLKLWSQHQKQPSNARLLSITTDERFSSRWPDVDAPELEVLLLNLRSRTYSLPSFINKMTKLKALIVTNCGPFQTEVSTTDFHLFNYRSLERIRLERIIVPSLDYQNAKPFLNVQKVSLFMCKVGQAFANCPAEIGDLLPNLLEISIDFCNDLITLPNGVCEIVNLEKLSVTNCHGLSCMPEELGKLANLKTLRLRSCIHLEELPESMAELSELAVVDVSGCLGLDRLPKKIGELRNLKKLDMRRCSSLQELPLSVRNLKELRILCDKGVGEWLKKRAPRLAKQVKVLEEEPSLDFLNL